MSTALVIWLIGVLFTMGYANISTKNWKEDVLHAVVLWILWPFLLGRYIEHRKGEEP